VGIYAERLLDDKLPRTSSRMGRGGGEAADVADHRPEAGGLGVHPVLENLSRTGYAASMNPASAPVPSAPRTAVVTGGNRGIGFAVAERFLRRGCHVVLVARDEERGERARSALAGLGGAAVTLVVGDLSSVRTVRAAAESVRAACGSIDVLVHTTPASGRAAAC